jgi:hypothetical protein
MNPHISDCGKVKGTAEAQRTQSKRIEPEHEETQEANNKTLPPHRGKK